MSNPSTLTTNATAFMASISPFGLVDAGQAGRGGTVAAAITQAYLLPIPGIATATFLAVTIITHRRRGAGTRYRRRLLVRAARAGRLRPGAAGAGLDHRRRPGTVPGLALPRLRHVRPAQQARLAGAALFVTLGLFTG